MSRGVNKVILIGNLGADPESRSTPGGTQVANLRIATTDSFKDKQSGEWQERTEWHRVALFGRLAEVASEYLRKGSKVYIEGSLRTRKWQDKDGNDRYSTEVIGNEMQMLDGKSSAERPPAQRQSAPAPQSQPSQDEFDDDIPFVWAALLPTGLAAMAAMSGASQWIA